MAAERSAWRGNVDGFADPVEEWASETESQFVLAHAAAADIAARYVRAGMVAVIEGVIDEPMYVEYDELRALHPRKVLLAPALEVALERNHRRTSKDFDTARLDASARRLHPRLLRENTAEAGWHVVDTSALSVDQTVDAIIARYGP